MRTVDLEAWLANSLAGYRGRVAKAGAMKKAKTVKQIGMIVRRETRVDMADAWVRKIAREEIGVMLTQSSRTFGEITRELQRLRIDLESLKRRSGEFTGMTETETSDLVKKLVKLQVSEKDIHNLVFEVLHKFYGSPPIEHPSFREAISARHAQWWRKDQG